MRVEMYRTYGSRIPLPSLRAGPGSEELYVQDLERITHAAAELFEKTYSGKRPTLSVPDIRRELIAPLNDAAHRLLAARGKPLRYTPSSEESHPVTSREVASRGKLRGTPLRQYLKTTIETLLLSIGYTYSPPTHESPGFYHPPQGDPRSEYYHVSRWGSSRAAARGGD